MIASIAPPWALAVTIQGESRLSVFTGGTAWDTHGLSGTRTLGVLPETLILDGGGRRLPLASLHPGDRVAVWGVVRPDGALLAVSITAPGHSPVQAKAAAAAPGIQGVVLRRSGETLDLLTDPGARHGVVVTAATIVTRDGRPVPAADIAPYDLLRVDGPMNSDGSLVATRIEVQFTAARAVQVSGPADQVLGSVGGLVVGGTMACTFAETYLVHGTTRMTLAQLAPGHAVTVFGVPIAASGTPIGLIARVVVAR